MWWTASWWEAFTAQFWGELLAGALLLAVGLWFEAYLDEKRDQRHADDGTWLQNTVDALIKQRDRKHDEKSE